MKAFVMKEIGTVGKMEKPAPKPGPNDAIVKTTAALICTSDSHTVAGGIGPRSDLTLGHEAVGVVAEVGSAVENVRPGDRVLAGAITPNWHIAQIDIVWDETLALEGRAGYYDGVGALKDMVQNHLLQLLCLVAMEPPISLDARDLRDRKVDVLRSIRPLGEDDAIRLTRRGRYTSGRIDGVAVAAYVDEDGVDPTHRTETFAEMELQLDNWRWHGTRFRLRTGKALRRNRKERFAGTGKKLRSTFDKYRTCPVACTVILSPTCCGSASSPKPSSWR